MKSFMHYYGSKYGSAYRYLGPQHNHVIEPFAGSAGYSTYWEPKRVTLVELDPTIAGVWAFLIRSSYKDIMRLPIDIYSLDDVHACQEAKDFIGFQLDLRGVKPTQHRTKTLQRHRELVADPSSAQRPSTGNSSTKSFYDDHRFWGTFRRERAARQVMRIKHWKIIHGSYELAPDLEAHWHIDPPYVKAGKNYRHNAVDHEALARWCLARKGFVQVCESSGAQWLPFDKLLRNQELRAGTTTWAHGATEAALQFGRRALEFDIKTMKGDNGVEIGDRTTDGVRNGGTEERRRPAKASASASGRGERVGRRQLASS